MSPMSPTARTGTRELLAAVRRRGYEKTSGRRADDPRGFGGGAAGDPEGPAADGLSRTLRDVLPQNGIVTDELSQVGFASWFGFPVHAPRTFITSGFSGHARLRLPHRARRQGGDPDRPVVAITGDGGFMFGVQELATAVQFSIGLVTVLFNNNAYGNVLRDQRERFEGRVWRPTWSTPIL